MKTSKKILLTGMTGIVVFNPLSINFMADGLVTAINFVMQYVILGSPYVMGASGILLVIASTLMYSEYQYNQAAKLKKQTKEAKAKLPTAMQRQN